MSSLAFRREQVPSTSTGVNNGGLDDDSTIFDQFSDICARVGISNFVLFGWIQPNLTLAYASYGRGETLLRAQVDHSSILQNQKFIRLKPRAILDLNDLP